MNNKAKGYLNLKYFQLLAISLVIVFIPIIISSPFYLNLMIFVGLNTIVAVGLILLMGYAGQVSIGQSFFYGLGAYSSGILSTKFGLSPWSAFLVAILITAVIAFIIGLPSLRLAIYYLAMVTLGLSVIGHILFTELDDLTGGHEGLVGIPLLSIGTFEFDTDFKYYYLVWGFTIIIILISLNIANSNAGRSLRAIQGDPLAAQMLGVNIWMRKVEIFVISGIYSSIAGSLYTHYITYLNPGPFSLHYSVLVLAMIVVGGMGSIWGAFWGALILTALPEYLREFETFNPVFYGLIMMLIIILMPGGISEGIDKLNQKLLQPRLRFLSRKEV